jgi:hypothetical protein
MSTVPSRVAIFLPARRRREVLHVELLCDRIRLGLDVDRLGAVHHAVAIDQHVPVDVGEPQLPDLGRDLGGLRARILPLDVLDEQDEVLDRHDLDLLACGELGERDLVRRFVHDVLRISFHGLDCLVDLLLLDLLDLRRSTMR